MAVSTVLFLALILFFAGHSEAHNITKILAEFPQYSLYNSFLTKTNVADEISHLHYITCLVLNNTVMTAIATKPLTEVRNILRLNVLRHYYDYHGLMGSVYQGTASSTTLYQAKGNLNLVKFVNKGGVITFKSAAPGSKVLSFCTKSVKQIPFAFSMLEISEPIMVPGITNTSPASDLNITMVLEKVGHHKTFVGLIVSSGVIKIFKNAIKKGGFTIFAPSDEAFEKRGLLPDLRKLSNAEVVHLLEYHAVPQYTTVETLMTNSEPIQTLTSNVAGKYEITTTTADDEDSTVTLHSGISSSRISGTVFDSTDLAIFTVDSVLLPTELFRAGFCFAPAPLK